VIHVYNIKVRSVLIRLVDREYFLLKDLVGKPIMLCVLVDFACMSNLIEPMKKGVMEF
jgi:hypothetical protein